MISNIWQDKISKIGEPKYYNNILVNIESSDFARHISNKDIGFIDTLVDILLGGSVVIVKKCFQPEFLGEMKRAVWAFKESNASHDAKKFEIVEGCPDFWRKVDAPIGPPGGYTFIGNQFYFFRWNKHLPFEKFDSAIWDSVKILSSGSPDTFKQNTPKDGVIDRVVFNHYPAGAGYVSEHRDPSANQKIVPGMILSAYDTDYSDGGFFVIDARSNKQFIESKIEPGDLVAWYPTVYHGAETPDNNGADDVWNSIGGRWQMAFFSVDSHHKEKRHTAVI